MKVYEFSYNCFPKIDEPIALCLGFFDGLHIGHRSIINEAKKYGRKVGLLTFSNSAYNFFNNTNELLTPQKKKIEILESLAVDYYLEIEMTKDLINCSPKEFMENLKALNPAVCLCGPDYTFGKNKKGTIKDLQNNFYTKVVGFETYENEKIGTQRIISAIKNGDIEAANKMLGRNYSVAGRVEEGLQNGIKFGFPTANLAIDNYCAPKEGVYFGYAVIDDEKLPAIASFGTHPTIDKLDSPILEVNILDFHRDLYGEYIEFEFIQYTRGNYQFKNEYDLVYQLESDKRDAFDFFNKKN